MRALSMEAAGTSFARDRAFADAAENHRRGLIKIINDDITQNAGGKNQGYVAGAELWEKVPDFQYESPGFQAGFAESRPDLMILTGWFAAACLAAMIATARVRVS